MVRATVQARRVQRLQQLRNQDAAYSAQLAVESKRSRHAAEDAAMASLGQEFEAERAARELQLQEQYNTAMAGIGQGHALAREAEAHIVARASEQYWSFVRAQQAEQHRSQAAREEAKNARQHREAPRTDLLKRLHRVKEVEQDRAAAAAAAAATRQPPAAMEVVERDPTHTPSTATHLHAVRTPVVVREAGAANATAFEAARAESEKDVPLGPYLTSISIRLLGACGAIGATPWASPLPTPRRHTSARVPCTAPRAESTTLARPTSCVPTRRQVWPWQPARDSESQKYSVHKIPNLNSAALLPLPRRASTSLTMLS